MLTAVAAAGFEAMDMWMAHLNWRWATPEHIAIARDLLDRHGIRVVSLAGNFGETPSDLAAACASRTRSTSTCSAAWATCCGTTARARSRCCASTVSASPTRTTPRRRPQEVLALIGDADDVLGAAVDTGWWATQGYDPVQAIRDLQGRLFYVHLKDVEAPGTHNTCMHGEGVAEIAACVDELLELGYLGALSIEHEPYDRDPTRRVHPDARS